MQQGSFFCCQRRENCWSSALGLMIFTATWTEMLLDEESRGATEEISTSSEFTSVFVSANLVKQPSILSPWWSCWIPKVKQRSTLLDPCSNNKKQFVCTLDFNLHLHPLKTSFVVKVKRLICEEAAEDTRKKQQMLSNVFATVSNSLKCLYDDSAVNKKSVCLPRLTLLFLFKGHLKTRAPPIASPPVTSAQILSSVWISVRLDASRGSSLSVISVPKVLHFTHSRLFPLRDLQSNFKF